MFFFFTVTIYYRLFGLSIGVDKKFAVTWRPQIGMCFAKASMIALSTRESYDSATKRSR